MINLQKNEQELTNSVMSKINLSKDKENLEKHVVSLSKCVVDLSKKAEVDLGATKARVVLVLDYSGSMSRLYKDGTVQETINRLVPLGLTFDDNGSIDMFLFQTDFRKMEDITLDNYENYIHDVVDKSGYSMGGTRYAPVLEAILGNKEAKKGLFGKLLNKNNNNTLDTTNDPTFVLFITDGDSSDTSNTDKVIRESSKKEYKTFIQFIGIGSAGFKYLRDLDDLSGREVDNTGFSKMKDLENVSDDELYTAILEQYVDWLKVM